MVGARNFFIGVIAGLLHMFVSPFITGFIPSFPFSAFIIHPVMIGIWVLVASLILERLGH